MPSASSSTLDGLISRWIRLWRWAKSSAEATPVMILSISSAVIRVWSRFSKRQAVDELEDQVRRAFFLAVIVDRDDIGMACQPGRRPRLDLEPITGALRLDHLRPQDLDGHVTVQRGVVRLVDRGEAAPSDDADHLVGAVPPERLRQRGRAHGKPRPRPASREAGVPDDLASPDERITVAIRDGLDTAPSCPGSILGNRASPIGHAHDSASDRAPLPAPELALSLPSERAPPGSSGQPLSPTREYAAPPMADHGCDRTTCWS